MSDQHSEGLEHDNPRYQHVLIHLCESCGGAFEAGDEVVSLSDGFVDENTHFDVNNRRFWHRRCFPEAEFREVLSS